MASPILGVRLVAQIEDFQRNMKRAEGSLRGFQSATRNILRLGGTLMAMETLTRAATEFNDALTSGDWTKFGEGLPIIGQYIKDLKALKSSLYGWTELAQTQKSAAENIAKVKDTIRGVHDIQREAGRAGLTGYDLERQQVTDKLNQTLEQWTAFAEKNPKWEDKINEAKLKLVQAYPQEIISINKKELDEKYKKYAEESIKGFTTMKFNLDEMAKATKEVTDILEKLKSPYDKYLDEIEKYLSLAEAGRISSAQYEQLKALAAGEALKGATATNLINPGEGVSYNPALMGFPQMGFNVATVDNQMLGLSKEQVRLLRDVVNNTKPKETATLPY
jgi:hypothetical protein